jgi:hypothetical protein
LGYGADSYSAKATRSLKKMKGTDLQDNKLNTHTLLELIDKVLEKAFQFN